MSASSSLVEAWARIVRCRFTYPDKGSRRIYEGQGGDEDGAPVELHHVAVLLVGNHLVAKRLRVGQQLGRRLHPVPEICGTPEVGGTVSAMVLQAAGKRALAAVVADDVGRGAEQLLEVVEERGGAANEAGDFEEARLEAGQCAELVISNSERFIDVCGEGVVGLENGQLGDDAGERLSSHTIGRNSASQALLKERQAER